MSDEDFVRCPECGNLNIKGSTTCLFCDTELEIEEGLTEEKIETYPCPSCTTDLPINVTSCPICGWAKKEGAPDTPTDRGETIGVPQISQETIPTTEPEADLKKESPAIPEILEEERPVSEEIITKEEEKEIITEKTGIDTKFGLLLIASLVLISLIHYGINTLIALASIRITDPNIQLLPFSENMAEMLEISALSLYLLVPITILSGYFVSYLVRKREKRIKTLLIWLGIFIFIDIVIHIILPLVITFIFYPREIVFSIIAGASFTFLVTNIIFMFTPYFVGGLWMFEKIDKLYFPKRYATS